VLIATFYVVLDAVRDSREIDRWMTIFLGLMAIVALIGVAQVGFCPALTAAPGLAALPLVGRVFARCQRAHAFYSIYMTLAGVLTLVLLSALPRLLHRRGSGGAWPPLAWVAATLGLGATYVRGAWIGFGAGVLVVLGLLKRGRALVAVGAVALAVALVLVPTVRRRAESIVDPADPTARERIAMWSSALRMARDHPLTGIGPGHVKSEYPRYAAPEFQTKRRGHLHNTPLQILVERGLIGAAAWVAVFVAFFRGAASAFRGLPPAAGLERALVGGSIAAIAGFLVGGLFEYNFGDSEVALVAYVVMAIPFVVGVDATV
jgi:O-antigen ligase